LNKAAGAMITIFRSLDLVTGWAYVCEDENITENSVS